MAWLPPWFVIDKPTTAPATSNLPAGFVIDQPVQQLTWAQKLAKWLNWTTENIFKPWASIASGLLQWVANVWGKLEKTIDKSNDRLNEKLFGKKTNLYEQSMARDARFEQKWGNAPVFSKLWVDTQWKPFEYAQTAWDIYAKTLLIPWSTVPWKTFIRRAVKNAAVSALKTEAGTLLTEQRNATPTELGISAWVGWLFWWFFWPKWSTRDYEKLVQPKMTPTEQADRAAQWLTKTNALWKIKVLANSQEQKAAQVAKDIWLSPWKTVVHNINKTIQAEAKETDNLIKIVKDNAKQIDTKTFESEINKIKTPISIKWDRVMEAKFNSVKKAILEIWNNTKNKDSAWMLQTRKTFDQLIRQEFPNLYTSDTLTPIKTVVTMIRKIPNLLVNKTVWWDVVKNSLDKQSSMMTIIENLAKKTEKVWSSAMSRFWSRAWNTVKDVWLLAWWLGILNAVKKTSAGNQ